ncbi:MAG: BTAD domain-containing putative transcriptional regulator, partial [Acidimicrobiia bacterium]
MPPWQDEQRSVLDGLPRCSCRPTDDHGLASRGALGRSQLPQRGSHRADVEVAAELGLLGRAHPFDERLWAQFMLALYRSGR